VYNYLAREAIVSSGQIFPYWLGYSSLPEYTYGSINHLSPASPSYGSVTPPSAMYVLTLILCYFLGSPLMSRPRNTPSLFSPSPSPSPSQASSTLEYHQASPEPSPTRNPGRRRQGGRHKQGCRKATPISDRIPGMWCCSMCDLGFKRRSDCERHATGKRAICLACRVELSGRMDSLRRHFKKHCTGNVANLRLEDAFTQV